VTPPCSFHSAGLCWGSAQIRLSAGFRTWLISERDLQTMHDPRLPPFEPAARRVFDHRGPPLPYRISAGSRCPRRVGRRILSWLAAAPSGTSLLLFAYAFGNKGARCWRELARWGSARGGDCMLGAVQDLMGPLRSQGIVCCTDADPLGSAKK